MVMIIETTTSHGSMASSATRSGTTIGADGGRKVAIRATVPVGSLSTERIATKYEIIAIIVTGVEALEASSMRDASAPRNPSAVEYSVYPRMNQITSMTMPIGVVEGSSKDPVSRAAIRAAPMKTASWR